jgi:hypothetical protein
MEEMMYRGLPKALSVLLILSYISSCNKKTNEGISTIELSESRATPAPTAPIKALKIGIVKEPFVDGCGCYFRFSDDYNQGNRSYVFLADIIEKEGDAQMNIDGTDVRLKLVKRVETEGETKIGSTRKEFYKSGDIEVGIEYVVTKACEPNDGSCESTDYSATITVTRNGVYQKIIALGDCGC